MIALIKRELLLATRIGSGFWLTSGFFLILVMFVPFGIGVDKAILAEIAPGILWIGALLSCLLSLDRIFQQDWEDGTLEALYTAPIPFTGVISAKIISHWIITGLPISIISMPLGYLLYLPTSSYIWLVISLLLGTPALSAIGTFGASLTIGIKRGGLLLSLLILPFYIPTLILGAQCSNIDTKNPLPLLALIAAISLTSSVFLPLASAFALRVNLR